MQLSPMTLQDIYSHTSLEYELSRELLLEKIAFTAVSFFCVSTELRFLVTLKDDSITDYQQKRVESEYYHGKALEIGVTFFPSECPLVNHILQSYNKHHSPTMQIIKENEETNESLKIIRPSKGIESNKHQPIIRNHLKTPFQVPSSDFRK